MGIAIVNSGELALASAPVATNTTLVAEAVEGCVVMVVVVVTVGTPTVIDVVNGHPGTGSRLICWEGTLRNLRAPTVACPNDELAFQMECQTLAPECWQTESQQM